MRRANGAKMGQTLRQSMPFHAHYALMQLTVSGPHSQQPRDCHSKFPRYPYTIGVYPIFVSTIPAQTRQGERAHC